MQEVITVPSSVREHMERFATDIDSSFDLPEMVQDQVDEALRLLRRNQSQEAMQVMSKALKALSRIEPELFTLIVGASMGHRMLTILEEEDVPVRVRQPNQWDCFFGPPPVVYATRRKTKIYRFS